MNFKIKNLTFLICSLFLFFGCKKEYVSIKDMQYLKNSTHVLLKKEVIKNSKYKYLSDHGYSGEKISEEFIVENLELKTSQTYSEIDFGKRVLPYIREYICNISWEHLKDVNYLAKLDSALGKLIKSAKITKLKLNGEFDIETFRLAEEYITDKNKMDIECHLDFKNRYLVLINKKTELILTVDLNSGVSKKNDFISNILFCNADENKILFVSNNGNGLKLMINKYVVQIDEINKFYVGSILIKNQFLYIQDFSFDRFGLYKFNLIEKRKVYYKKGLELYQLIDLIR